MSVRATVCIVIVFCSSGCDPAVQHELVESGMWQGLSPLDPGQPDSLDAENPEDLLTGKWVFREGVKACSGYLTRVEDEDFCAQSIPEDWRPFEFDGETYHLVPLAAEQRRQMLPLDREGALAGSRDAAVRSSGRP